MEEQIQEQYDRLCQIPIVAGALRELETKLSPDLYYHSLAHTKDVLREVTTFALHDELDARQLELLAVGAVFHDMGFIWKHVDNEWVGATRA